MRVYVNRMPVEIAASATLAELLEVQKIPVDGTAVAVNNRVVPRAEWPTTRLDEEAKVTVIRAVCGG